MLIKINIPCKKEDKDYENFDMFHTKLGQVFSLLKNTTNQNTLKRLIAERPEDYYNINRLRKQLTLYSLPYTIAIAVYRLIHEFITNVQGEYNNGKNT